MPLLDHFHPPLSAQRHWESFHTTWASAIADALNERWLPEGYFAEEQVHPSARIEIDVAAFEEQPSAGRRDNNGGGVATAPAPAWSPPAAVWSMPVVFLDRFEVLVFQGEGGPTLVGAIELISPANKDRDKSRRAFATKCASYLHQGISLVIIDVVTSRQANLHNEIVALTGNGEGFLLPPTATLYAVAYRPTRRDDQDRVEIWPAELRTGELLPTLPLALGGEQYVPLDLEETYMNACRRRRLA